jgi:hypothetical protein
LAITVANDLGDAISTQELGEELDHVVGCKGRFNSPDNIADEGLTVLVTDAEASCRPPLGSTNAVY